ncbi:TPA: hypothetical protein HA243_01370 [Candidatus Micrarchaeota archaeon]|nr:hypothetical protein [Candidatus Micrarchaeota archaeon]
MVYLEVYDSTFRYLEKIGIVDDVTNSSLLVLEPVMEHFTHGQNKERREKTFNEFIIENALFNYLHEGRLLIDFLSGAFYSSLGDGEKKEFMLIKNSTRRSLKFIRSEKTGEKDLKGLDLREFHFVDADSNEAFTVISSSELGFKNGNVNARLIENPNHPGKYSFIGLIASDDLFSGISEFSKLSQMLADLESAKEESKQLLQYSREHGLQEIAEYKSKGKFQVQDRKIMEINRRFIERHGMGFDEFLEDFFGLANDREKFIAMAEDYLAGCDGFMQAVYDTSYIFGIDLLDEKELISAYLSLVKRDLPGFEKSFLALQEAEKKEHRELKGLDMAFTRENIMERQREFMKENFAPADQKGYEEYSRKTRGMAADEIVSFLRETAACLEKSRGKVEDAEIDLTLIRALMREPNSLQFAADIRVKETDGGPDADEFYDYTEASDSVREKYVFLAAAYHACKGDIGKAATLIQKNRLPTSECFEEMFIIGKILSFSENSSYKKYFSRAKHIDRERYRVELAKFLEEKEHDACTDPL